MRSRDIFQQKDRRHFPRKKVSFRVDYARASEMTDIGYADWGMTRDISVSGVFIEHTPHLILGEIVTIAFILPTGEAYKLPARVVRQSPEGMGLEFVNIERMGLRKIWKLWSYCTP